MIIYLAKFILCSGLFYAAYSLLLEKERAHQFKRFYLLVSLGLSLTIPLLTFENSSQVILKETESYLNIYNDVPISVNTVEISKPQEVNIYPNLIVVIYIGISIVLLLRFCLNFYKILSQTKGRTKTVYNGTTVILSENISTPYSFLNYIFLNKTEFEHNQIAEGILLHEFTHVRQKHSLDVIFIELLQVFLWFNPMLYLYRKAIQTNHEYLADEHVIQSSKDIPAYQMLLLNHISTQCGLSLTSQFNYLTLKKRLIMMSKTNSIKVVLGKQLLLIPVLGIALFLFSTKTEAQVNKTPNPTLNINETTSTTKGISEEEMNKYKAIESKYIVKGNATKTATNTNKITQDEKDILLPLYQKMSKAQKKQAHLIFIFHKVGSFERTRIAPSAEQLEAYKNAAEYGVWIDRKRVANASLKDYKPSDFKEVVIFKLPAKSKAKQNITYNYQIELITAKLSNEVYAKNKALEGKYTIAVVFDPSKNKLIFND